MSVYHQLGRVSHRTDGSVVLRGWDPMSWMFGFVLLVILIPDSLGHALEAGGWRWIFPALYVALAVGSFFAARAMGRTVTFHMAAKTVFVHHFSRRSWSIAFADIAAVEGVAFDDGHPAALGIRLRSGGLQLLMVQNRKQASRDLSMSLRQMVLPG